MESEREGKENKNRERWKVRDDRTGEEVVTHARITRGDEGQRVKVMKTEEKMRREENLTKNVLLKDRFVFLLIVDNSHTVPHVVIAI